MSYDSANSGHITKKTTRYHVESLARGLRILTLFSDREPWLGQNEIMRRTGFNASTTLRLIRTLQSLEFLDQAPDTKRYRPGVAVLKLGHGAIAGLGLRDASEPYLKQLANELNETVNLGILSGNQVVYIERIEREKIVTAEISVGSSLPAYSTSIGKLLLAYLPNEDVEEIFSETELVKTGPNTVSDLASLTEELRRTRSLGYAVQDEELVAGLRSVAVPVRNDQSDPIAAINVAVPSQRVALDTLLTTILPALSRTALNISAVLGYRRDAPSTASNDVSDVHAFVKSKDQDGGGSDV